MRLCGNVEFNGELHEYYQNGKTYSGVTGTIARQLNMRLPEEFVGEHQLEGIHVHKAAHEYLTTGWTDSTHPGVIWLIGYLSTEYSPAQYSRFSEVLVTDNSRYASAVDIICELVNAPDELIIFDIKKGIFHRQYVSWQLGIYKYLLENAGNKVTDCVCLCLKDREAYPIIPVPRERVEKLLYGTK
jgi:hypothetical protein